MNPKLEQKFKRSLLAKQLLSKVPFFAIFIVFIFIVTNLKYAPIYFLFYLLFLSFYFAYVNIQKKILYSDKNLFTKLISRNKVYLNDLENIYEYKGVPFYLFSEIYSDARITFASNTLLFRFMDIVLENPEYAKTLSQLQVFTQTDRFQNSDSVYTSDFIKKELSPMFVDSLVNLISEIEGYSEDKPLITLTLNRSSWVEYFDVYSKKYSELIQLVSPQSTFEYSRSVFDDEYLTSSYLPNIKAYLESFKKKQYRNLGFGFHHSNYLIKEKEGETPVKYYDFEAMNEQFDKVKEL